MLEKHDKYYMDLAFQISHGSKCVRAKYGTVIVTKDGRVASTGYNGKPAKSVNDNICYREGLPPNHPKENCCLHSEANAIMFSHPNDRAGGTMYVSGVPCCDCGLLIMQSGIKRLVYYDGISPTGHRGSSTDDFWEKYGSTVKRVAYTETDWIHKYRK